MELLVTRFSTLTDLDPLGQGGYGLVYKAQHAEWGTIAYKQLLAQFIKKKEEIELKKEAEIHSKLNHPNIVKFIAMVWEPGYYGLVLEFMEFGEILDYLQDYDPPWELKLSMIQDIILGMCYLHSLNPPIIHGDLKPQNVLLNGNLVAKICDFGFAEWRKYSDSHSQKKIRFGTVSHVPPETWNDPFRRKNEQFDVYSIGICMWEILTVLKPFEIMNPSVIKESVLGNKRPDLKLIPLEVPETISKLIGRCWEQDPANRPNFCEIKTAIETEMNIKRRKSILSIKKQEDSISGKNERLPSNIQSFEQNDLTPISDLGDDIILANYNGKESNRIVIVKHSSRNSRNFNQDLMKEAELISKLRHSHIIEFLGIYYSDTMFLVMEYASMGPLDAFLRKHPTFATGNIIRFIYQLATGMAYLERKRIVHCYLAARNILLVSEQLAKISNFSYSKVLEPNLTHCLIEPNDFKEHLKWNAPEIQRMNNINLKSDSWSFGITLWEALSYGSVPYEGMTDDQILDFINTGRRLEKPINCSQELYSLMIRCWKSDTEIRPMFEEIIDVLHEYLSVIESHSNLKYCLSKRSPIRNLNIKEICPIDTNLKESIIQEIDVIDLKIVINLSDGQFVQKKIYRLGQELGYAIEINGDEETPNMDMKNNALKCAMTIKKLRHDFIVRLIGICNVGSRFIYITEYALIGPINIFLKNHTDTPIHEIIKLMYQVAQGMAYLEMNRIVHCSIAANHIILVSEQHAKISSFTHSEELDWKDSYCIKDLTNEKCLLKYLAPESLSKNELSSKSDVWSFGITLWETLSYGEKPFYGIEDFLKIQKLQRSDSFIMKKPKNCPEHVYFLMLECWCQIPEYRPAFRKIVWTFESMFRQMSMHPFQLDSKTGLNNIRLIESSQLKSSRDIGSGCFGQNYLGICKLGNEVYHSVIKTADESTALTTLVYFSKEAQILSKLCNPYIARIVGMCVDIDCIALIIQASELGTLGTFLNRQTLPVITLVRHMHQVALGMTYLHENQILHLNLGASSVYLMSEDHATIGNFEVSARINKEEKFVCINRSFDHDFKFEWPAPECSRLKQGNEGSDVWSFGRTLWEVLSSHNIYMYSDSEILTFRDKGNLQQPDQCSNTLYTLMTNCWECDSNLRPGFAEISEFLHSELQELLSIDSSNLIFIGELFDGVFGPVMLASYESDMTITHVQVETSNSEQELTNQLRLLSRLHHKNIVQLIGYCRTDENLALVMDYPMYGRLDHFLQENPLIPTNKIVFLINQVADGMAYLEELRVVHLSLDVGSIQLKSPQHAKISNFKLSVELPRHQDWFDLRIINVSLRIHSRLAASECIMYNRANSKSDVWSFGILIWEVVTNKTRDNETNIEFHRAIRNGNAVTKPSYFHQSLFDLMSACLQLKATDRPTFENIRNSCLAITTEPIEDICSDLQIHITPEQFNNRFHLISSSKIRCQNKEIFKGEFVSIMQGVYTSPNKSELMVALHTVSDPKYNYEVSKHFVHAAHIMSLLRHESIVDFIGIYINNKVTLVLEFAEFGSLREFLIENPTTPLERILSIMHQVAEGMVYMRTRCIVHRNLRAETVLMTSQVQAKISNFEYSKQLDKNRECSEFQEIKSLLRWTAPECLQSQKYFYKSDVFSFGITFWEAISYGALPYADISCEMVRLYRLNGVTLSRPKLCSPKIYHVMLGCWRDDFGNRPQFEDIIEVLSDASKQFPNEMWNQQLPILNSSSIVLQKNEICERQYGSMWRAVYSSSDGCEMIVAVKTIKESLNLNFLASKQLVNESQLMSKLRNVNIIDFIGICNGKTPMLVIEFSNIGSLPDFLRSNRTTPIERVLALMLQVVEGMVHMRTCRIVHRSLKAKHILLTSQMQAKVSNFEFSEEIDEGKQCCHFEERQAFNKWTAPECFMKNAFHFKSDVFSFGVALWEATSYGAIPYEGNTDDEVRYRILNYIWLSKPRYCPEEIYNMMLTCWQTKLEN